MGFNILKNLKKFFGGSGRPSRGPGNRTPAQRSPSPVPMLNRSVSVQSRRPTLPRTLSMPANRFDYSYFSGESSGGDGGGGGPGGGPGGNSSDENGYPGKMKDFYLLCPLCGEKVSSDNEMQTHCERAHQHVLKRGHHCTKCNASLRDRNELKTHFSKDCRLRFFSGFLELRERWRVGRRTMTFFGWEGSAHDARVLMDAVNRDDSFPKPPDGRYYLCDAGYANYDNFLTPYRGYRYNLPEFNNSNIPAQNPEELFNHRHAQLRNVVERTFGVLKSRFPILAHGMPCYRLKSQPEIVIACCVLHNWIRLCQPHDDIFETNHPHFAADTLLQSARRYPNQERVHAQNQIRNEIANQMWEDFVG